MNLNDIFINYDPTVVIYNGSVFPIRGEPNLYYCAYRATVKPNVNMPSFPFVTYIRL